MAKNPRMTMGEALSIVRLGSPKPVTVKAIESRGCFCGNVGTYVD